MSKFFKWAELPARKDVYTHAGTTTWGNHDLYPIPRKERTWGWMAYVSYQVVVGVNISNYTLASSYIAVGLTVGQTLGAVLAGAVIASIISYITCRPGLDHAIGFVSLYVVFVCWILTNDRLFGCAPSSVHVVFTCRYSSCVLLELFS
jgi:NCS1 family nucleobase:cation symporter-1